jgi:hypothetical protein
LLSLLDDFGGTNDRFPGFFRKLIGVGGLHN